MVQCGVSAVWIGLGITVVILGEWIAGVIIIVAATVGLGIILLKADHRPNGGSRDGG